MERLRTLLARWKVQVSVVAGALVIATAYGTCTVEPPADEVSEITPTVETVEQATTVEVSATTSVEEENSATSTTETTATETTTE